MELILASKSPRRKEILEKLGYEFKILSLDTDETMDPRLDIKTNVLNVSYKKAYAVFEQNQDACVLGCDTVVVFNNKIYGKPKSKEDAYNTLSLLNNNTHEVISAVNIITKDKTYSFTQTSYVTFKNNTKQELLDYIDTKECMDKAGSYAIQGLGGNLILKYEGELDNIIGLPSKEVDEILKEVLK